MSYIDTFSADNGPWRTRATSLTINERRSPREIDISQDQAPARGMIARSGQPTVRQIFIADEPVGRLGRLATMNGPIKSASR